VTTKVTTESTSNNGGARVRKGLALTFEPFFSSTARGLVWLRALAPYAAIELILPGGSLIALFLWFYNHHKRTTADRQRATAVVPRYSEA
jgi:hypothetical protein